MAKNLSAPMREALKATRAGNPAEATRLIQQALSGGNAASADLNQRTDTGDNRRPESFFQRAARMAQTRPRANGPAIPESAQWIARTHVEGGHERPFRLYVPSVAPRGLIVMLHGCSQSPEDFAIGTGMTTIAEARDFLVVWPEQPKSANAHGCWNWFDPRHQGRDDGEVAVVAGIVQTLTTEYALQEGSAIIAGLSAGGAKASNIVAAYPELFSVAAIHSGLVHSAASDVGAAFAAMKTPPVPTPRGTDVPTLILHGSADSTVSPGNGAAIEQSIGFDDHQVAEEIAVVNGRSLRIRRALDSQGNLRHESWLIEGTGHAWSGGHPGGSYTDSSGPDASAAILRFFDEVTKG